MAAGRLDLLAHVYEQPTRSLLARWAPARVGLAVDLGCGPGHTTRLLHAVLRARAAGRRRAVARRTRRSPGRQLADLPGVEVLEDDVTQPLPVEGADLVFARFLLTHLAPRRRRCAPGPPRWLPAAG